MPATCLICKKTARKNVSMHWFPPKSAPVKRQRWMAAFQLEEHQVQEHHRVCNRHFPSGDVSQPPSLNLGKRFASPKKLATPRGLRTIKRKRLCPLRVMITPKRSLSSTPSTSREVTPASSSEDPLSTTLSTSSRQSSVEALSSSELSFDTSSISGSITAQNDTEVIINKALVARIEVLEAENKSLKNKLTDKSTAHFRLEDIAGNDSLIRFHTGFESYETLIAFFDFLGDAVNNLKYWGT